MRPNNPSDVLSLSVLREFLSCMETKTQWPEPGAPWSMHGSTRQSSYWVNAFWEEGAGEIRVALGMRELFTCSCPVCRAAGDKT